MARDVPPPLPNPESAQGTYLKAVGTTLPAVLIWIFASSFLLPKLQWLWKETNLTGSKAQWIMDTSQFLSREMGFAVPAVMILILVLEVRFPTWARYRRPVIATMAIVIHTIVLVALAAISTSVLLAAPILTRIK